jgi:para-nitrobenzyl esterase
MTIHLKPKTYKKMKSISRRHFVSKMSASAVTAVAFPALGFTAPGYFNPYIGSDEFVEVEIAHGKIRGAKSEGINIFKGIPYGGRVSGDRRFRRPAPLEKWTGVRDALQLGAPAMQSGGRGAPAPAEDCLFLNVWTPANDNKKRPVMFYNHGGGYVSGSGGAGGQDGTNLARNFDVVVVQTNHRLGLFGFLYLDEIAGSEYTGSGNMGILDITAGLKWVQENIAGFGGDPNNVMIFGESGGGGKTSCLYALPEAEPYFNKASIESGPGVRMLTREMAAATTEAVLKELNISPGNWKRILEIPAADLLTIQNKFPFVPPFQEKNTPVGANGFGPVVQCFHTIPLTPPHRKSPATNRYLPVGMRMSMPFLPCNDRIRNLLR